MGDLDDESARGSRNFNLKPQSFLGSYQSWITSLRHF
jgi:hypothetical protein